MNKKIINFLAALATVTCTTGIEAANNSKIYADDQKGIESIQADVNNETETKDTELSESVEEKKEAKRSEEPTQEEEQKELEVSQKSTDVEEQKETERSEESTKAVVDQVKTEDIIEDVEEVSVYNSNSELTAEEALAIINAEKGTMKEFNYLIGKSYNESYEKLEKEIQIAIVNKRVSVGRDLTLDEAKTEITNIINKFVMIYDNIYYNRSVPISDFEYIGITGVTEQYLSAIRSACYYKVSKSKFDTSLEILQGCVDGVLGYSSTLDIINAEKGTMKEFNYLIGKSYNESYEKLEKEIQIAIVNKRVSVGRDLTLDEAKTEITNIINKFVMIYDNIYYNRSVPISDFEYIGITGVTEQYLSAIRSACYYKVSKSKFDTSLEILQGYVSEAIRIAKIEEEAILAINESRETIDANGYVYEYSLIGKSQVKSIKLSLIQSAIKIKIQQKQASLTKSEIVAVISQVESIYSRIISGTATVADYEYIGITGVVKENISFVNVQLKGISEFDFETLQVRVNKAVSLFAIKAKITSGTVTEEDFIEAGITGVTSTNIKYVKDKLQSETDVDVTALQVTVDKIVEEFNVKYKAYLNILGGSATLVDFEAFGKHSVTEFNLNYVNLHIKEYESASFEELDVIIDSLVEAHASYTRISAGTATIVDYERLNIVGVSYENIEFVNLELKGQVHFEYSSLKASVEKALQVYASVVNINISSETIEDYYRLGISSTDLVQNKFYFVKACVQAAKDGKGSNLSKDEIIEVVQKALVEYDNFFNMYK